MIHAVPIQHQLELPQPPDPQHWPDPVLVDRESQFLGSPAQLHAQGAETGHPRHHRLPHAAPVADEVPEAHAGAHVGPEGRETLGGHVDVHGGDGGEPVGADALGEVEECFEVRACLHGEGVGGVEDVGRFVVDGPAGLEETRLAVLSGLVVRVIAAVIPSPFAAMVCDSRFAPRTVEMDDLVAKDVDVDHATDFVWEFREEVTALRLRPAIPW